MQKKIFLFLCLPLLLSGCFPAYVPVETGPRAILTLRTNNAYFDFSMWVWDGTDPCSKKRLGVVKVDHGEIEKSFPIPAGQRVDIFNQIHHPKWGLFNSKSGGVVFKKVSFVPEENKKYKIEYIYDGIEFGLLTNRTKYDIRYLEYNESGQEHDMTIDYWTYCEDSEKDESIKEEPLNPS